MGLAASLAACASAPQVVRDGGVDFARGKAVALAASDAPPLDDSLASQAGRQILARLDAAGAHDADPAKADYLIQVAVSRLPARLGVLRSSDAVKPDWLARPARSGLFSSAGPAEFSLTVAAIDAHSGKLVFRAVATTRAGGDQAKLLDRLVTAALAPPQSK